MSNFVKAMDKDSEAFKYLKTVFPKISIAKIKKGCFNGPQIEKLINNKDFIGKLGAIEKRAFNGIVATIKNFLGNKRAENYKEIIAEMMSAFRDMKVDMSLEIHFLHDHLEFFPENLGAYSDEHGERFHQDIALIEKRYKGKDYCKMLGEYCWTICRSSSEEHARKRSRTFFVNE